MYVHVYVECTHVYVHVFERDQNFNRMSLKNSMHEYSEIYVSTTIIYARSKPDYYL